MEATLADTPRPGQVRSLPVPYFETTVLPTGDGQQLRAEPLSGGRSWPDPTECGDRGVGKRGGFRWSSQYRGSDRDSRVAG